MAAEEDIPAVAAVGDNRPGAGKGSPVRGRRGELAFPFGLRGGEEEGVREERQRKESSEKVKKRKKQKKESI